MFACVYAEGFQDDWHECSNRSSHWPVAFVLAALPSFIRLVQSVKRYADSGLVTHLINVRTSLLFGGVGDLLVPMKGRKIRIWYHQLFVLLFMEAPR